MSILVVPMAKQFLILEKEIKNVSIQGDDVNVLLEDGSRLFLPLDFLEKLNHYIEDAIRKQGK